MFSSFILNNAFNVLCVNANASTKEIYQSLFNIKRYERRNYIQEYEHNTLIRLDFDRSDSNLDCALNALKDDNKRFLYSLFTLNAQCDKESATIFKKIYESAKLFGIIDYEALAFSLKKSTNNFNNLNIANILIYTYNFKNALSFYEKFLENDGIKDLYTYLNIDRGDLDKDILNKNTILYVITKELNAFYDYAVKHSLCKEDKDIKKAFLDKLKTFCNLDIEKYYVDDSASNIQKLCTHQDFYEDFKHVNTLLESLYKDVFNKESYDKLGSKALHIVDSTLALFAKYKDEKLNAFESNKLKSLASFTYQIKKELFIIYEELDLLSQNKDKLLTNFDLKILRKKKYNDISLIQEEQNKINPALDALNKFFEEIKDIYEDVYTKSLNIKESNYYKSEINKKVSFYKRRVKAYKKDVAQILVAISFMLIVFIYQYFH